MRCLFCFVLLLSLACGGSAQELESSKASACWRYMAEGKDALNRNHAPLLPSYAQCPITHKTLTWLTISRGHGMFAQIVRFLRDNPVWPDRHKLQDAAEQAITDTTPLKDIREYFRHYTPRTSKGVLIYAQKIVDQLPPQKRKAKLESLWIQTDFTPKDEQIFHTRFRRDLSSETYRARLDRLLLDGNYYGLKRMKQFVSKQCQDVIEYGLKLIRQKSKFRMVWVRIPACYKQYPGLMHQRIRWLIRKDEMEMALDVFRTAHQKGAFKNRPDLILRYRNYFAREYAAQKQYKKSVALCEEFPVAPENMGSKVDYAEGEWFRAWVELRHLNQPEIALNRFKDLHHHVTTPISVSKMAYWVGRSAEAAGQTKTSQTWYKKAGQFPHTYYGQMALRRLNQPIKIHLKNRLDSAPIRPEEQTLLSVVQLLEAYGFSGDQERVLLYLVQRASPQLGAYLVTLCHDINMAHLAVITAKYASQKSPVLTHHAYPILKLNRHILKKPYMDDVFLHALIRQESNFNTHSVSGAGARGYMQLMYDTACRKARQLGIQLKKHELTKNPQKNIAIGTTYLSELIKQFDGNYILALAGYNAGPHRVKNWVEKLGHPGHKNMDTIDWIEMIPYGETRGYVQRITESLLIYEARLNKKSRYANQINP